MGPRSPASINNRYFYLEGGWVRLPKVRSDPTMTPCQTMNGTIPTKVDISLKSNLTATLRITASSGAVGTKLDSPDPDPENPQYDGWGLHNAVVSNMVPDNRDNLRFIAGYGLPYRINNNLPSASITGAIPDETNFNWIQFGQDLSTKIASFPTNGQRGWELIQQLAQTHELGNRVRSRDGESRCRFKRRIQSISDWTANASFFFRPRTILPAKLRTAISASGSPTTIAINDSGLPADVSEFPVPPSGDRYVVA